MCKYCIFYFYCFILIICFSGGSRPNSQPSYGVSYSNQYTPLSFQEFEEPAQFIGDPPDIADMDATTGESLKVGLLFQAKSLGDQVRFRPFSLEIETVNAVHRFRAYPSHPCMMTFINSNDSATVVD
jgi:hypothetical protein